MKLSIKPYSLLLFTLTFILFVPLGTLSHESGHIAVAQILGYDTKLHHGSMNWGNNKLLEMQKAFYDKYALDTLRDLPAHAKTEYDQFMQKWRFDGFKVTLGGPLIMP